MANLIALFYNWWNLSLRFYDGGHHREAICADLLEQGAALSPLRSGCSRPMLMSGVGRQLQSGGQRTIKVSILHERRDQVARAIRQINGEIGQIRPITGAYAPKV